MKVLLLVLLVIAVSAEDRRRGFNRKMRRFVRSRWFRRYNRSHKNSVKELYRQLKKLKKSINALRIEAASKPVKEVQKTQAQIVTLRKEAGRVRRALADQVKEIRKYRRVQRKQFRAAKRGIVRTLKHQLNSTLREMKSQYKNKPDDFLFNFKTEARKIFNQPACKKYHRLCKKVYRRYVKKAKRTFGKLVGLIQLKQKINNVSSKKVKGAVVKTLYHFEKNYNKIDDNHQSVKNAFAQIKCAK
ncbi:hypothetical protein EIN_052680 [Entamoeba invadens IP1]|uniref:hypothetical protein n=1 Tax=Entamoeba invadens IP1 TaxID=370355 RepID=UPI0002C3F935|nr:hypothetical protein EIN_052680 [Entamoeba invadens IP1]ELP93053.1 hypothetical protein EIN_052680 [Entamoeba invadens IP1]|eukprot:XP_004259824.1 hypothetical protein EIN_052680 [Entamoeba invadens IP1]